MFRTILILGRVSNLPTVWTNVLVGWFLAGGVWDWELAWVIVGVSLLYVAGMTLNDAFDAEWDREHAPERPIPCGAISWQAVWILGFAQLAAGIVVLIGSTGVDPIWVAALVAAILLYDWIHKSTPWSVLVMGSCRGLVYLLAASAAIGRISWTVGALAVAMIAYVVGITLAARGERGTTVNSPFIGQEKICHVAVFAILLVAVFTLDTPLFEAGWKNSAIFVVSLVVLFVWVQNALDLLSRDIRSAIGALIAGITLMDGAAIAQLDWRIGLSCAALLPVTLVLQRKIPAT